MIKELDKKESETDYDVQTKALGSVKKLSTSFFTEEENKNIKETAYQHGVSLESVFTVFGFMLINHLNQN